ncbi:hypothetical protein LCGC14_0873390 [marine sediment metagenome]|uniref:Uncharacterized protein n=1 Tax=marine sediment metagenome TaxID=412755 RepID=A0A0F9RNN4_9ZZZZ
MRIIGEIKIELKDDGTPVGVELVVVECGCGFHIGLDHTFLDQVGTTDVVCPSCGVRLSLEPDCWPCGKLMREEAEDGDSKWSNYTESVNTKQNECPECKAGLHSIDWGSIEVMGDRVF